MSNGKGGEISRSTTVKMFTRGWRQAIYFPFGENSFEKIYMPGNLNEEISLWLGEHSYRGRDRPKSDFLFLSGLKEILEILFQNHEPFYSSTNGVVMALRDQREPNPPAKILFQVPESRPQEYELPRWKIVEAIRIMEGLEKIRRGSSSDMIDDPEAVSKAITSPAVKQEDLPPSPNDSDNK